MRTTSAFHSWQCRRGVRIGAPQRLTVMATTTSETGMKAKAKRRALPGQIVLVLQGGGALGAYQVGVYQALHEAGIEPDWVIGTSIGAINAAIIAGNEPQDRLTKLDEFWKRMERSNAWPFVPAWTGISDAW